MNAKTGPNHLHPHLRLHLHLHPHPHLHPQVAETVRKGGQEGNATLVRRLTLWGGTIGERRSKPLHLHPYLHLLVAEAALKGTRAWKVSRGGNRGTRHLCMRFTTGGDNRGTPHCAEDSPPGEAKARPNQQHPHQHLHLHLHLHSYLHPQAAKAVWEEGQ